MFLFSPLPQLPSGPDYQPEVGACEQTDVIVRKEKVIFQGHILEGVKARNI